jgi:hypothetical protein
MNRKLKALGLALFAAFAMSAVAAASASATTHDFSSSSKSGTTHLTAEAEGTQEFRSTTGDESKRVSCNKVNVEGTITGTTVDTVTVRPIYTECKAITGGTEVSATVNTTGCHYLFTGETTDDAATPGEHATVHVVNKEKCTHIDIKVTVFQVKCISIPTEQTLHGVTYTNTKTGEFEEITLKATVHGIKSTTTDSSTCPTKSGGTEEHTDGSYTGNVTVKGYEDKEHKKQVNITATTKTP